MYIATAAAAAADRRRTPAVNVERQAFRDKTSERPEIQSNLQERFGFHTRVTDDSLDDGVLAPERAVPLIVLTDRHAAGGTLVLSLFSESPHQITS